MAGIAGVPKSPVACLPTTPSGVLVGTAYWDSPSVAALGEFPILPDV